MILLHTTAAVLYAGLAFYGWRMQQSHPSPENPFSPRVLAQHFVLLLALLLHGATLLSGVIEALHFGFASALSMIFWLATTYYWIENLRIRVESLKTPVLLCTALSVLLPLWFPGQALAIDATSSILFRLHFLMAILAYSLFTLATLHAIVMTIVEHNLHQGHLQPFFAGLPPLLAMETHLFRMLNIAFLLLTIALVSGIFFSEAAFGKALTLTHKTIFAIMSWTIFAVLVAGRHMRGWRGRQALYWMLAGFVALLLTYVGTQFVLEVILGRSA